jgi:hypothetical protein
MARPCTVCGHPARAEIERALVAGHPSLRALADEHGLSDSSLARHQDTHLRRALARAVEEERVEVDADRLASWSYALQQKTLTLLLRAEREGDLANARGLIAEARKNLELLGRLAGVLDPHTVNVSIDQRRQLAVIASLSEEELRALAREAADGRAELLELGAGS